MIENTWCILATLIEIIFFGVAYKIQKLKIKNIEDEEQAEKTLERAKNTFYIWTDLSLVFTSLIMIFDVWADWHIILVAIYFGYHIISDLISVFKLKKDILKDYFLLKKVLFVVGFVLTFSIFFYEYNDYTFDQYFGNDICYKPVIYIYPETETEVQVSVGYPEKLSCVYPEYDTEEGWKVIAQPNGDLVDTKTGRNLYCLYWEGNQKQEYKFKDGFVVAGEDSAKFLEEKLAILGLNEREANEFIIYWLPKLEANKFNLIRFETMEEIEEYMPLNIEPNPDTVIRIVMDFKGLNRPIEIEEQKLEQVEREGYTVVEWGGSEF